VNQVNSPGGLRKPLDVCGQTERERRFSIIENLKDDRQAIRRELRLDARR
jgi:hypothetical protein